MEPPAQSPQQPQSPPPNVPAEQAGVPRLDVAKLLQGSSQAVLVFNGSEYRLRITRQGKLLLTK